MIFLSLAEENVIELLNMRGEIMEFIKKNNTFLFTVECSDLIKYCWLVGWVLRHINLCRLFSAKSIFM